jgi:3-phenylpropionate/cinnamic acid dioxygenase small subunit
VVSVEATRTAGLDGSSGQTASTGVYPAPCGRRIPTHDRRHLEIVEFLEEESAMLDDDNLMGWLALLEPDVVYRAPVRATRERGTIGPFETEMFHFNENSMTLTMKLVRLTQTTSAWSENPASRTHRIVHKIRAYELGQAGEYDVRSSIVLLRSRYDDPNLEMISARRADVIRGGQSWKIASRTLYFDQATLGVQNLAVYL